MRAQLTACAVLLAVASVAIAGASASISGPGLPEGKLAYTVDFELTVSRLDGSERRAIPPKPRKRNPRVDSYPRWSPDGSRLAFLRSGVALRAPNSTHERTPRNARASPKAWRGPPTASGWNASTSTRR